MKKRIILALFLFLLIPSVIWAAGATEWQSGQRHRWTSMNGRTGIAALTGASVGATDAADCISGTTIEFFHAVLSGTSEIWPLAGGGVTGWKLSEGSFEAIYVNSEQVLSSDVLQWKALAAGITPYANDAAVTDFVRGLFASYLAASAFSGDTDFALDSAVSEFVNALGRAISNGASVWGVSGGSVFMTGPSGVSATNVQANAMYSTIWNGPATQYLQVDGINKVLLEASQLRYASGGFVIRFVTPSDTVPNFILRDGDTYTGLGGNGTGVATLISGGSPFVRSSPAGVTIFYADGIPALVADSGGSTFRINDKTGASQIQVDENGAYAKTPTSDYEIVIKSYVDTGTSQFTGAHLSANQVACSIGYSFQGAVSGDSAIVTAPWTFVLTGVSLATSSGVVGTAGASVFLGDSTSQLAANISGSGGTAYSLSGDTRFEAGQDFRFQMGTVTTGRTWRVQLFGRKE